LYFSIFATHFYLNSSFNISSDPFRFVVIHYDTLQIPHSIIQATKPTRFR